VNQSKIVREPQEFLSHTNYLQLHFPCQAPGMPQSRSKIPVDQDFSILFLFSFLFNLSTRFLCIVSANFSYRAFSSFLTLFSLIACVLLYDPKSVYDSPMLWTLRTDLSLCFLLILHLLLLSLYSRHSFPLFLTLLE
jgi:hypothetical protein